MSSDSIGSGIFLNIAWGITRVSWRGWTMCCKTLFEPGWLPIGRIGHSHGYPPSKLGSGAIAPWCSSTSRKTMVGPPRRRGPIVQARMRRFFMKAASPRKSDGGGAPSLVSSIYAIFCSLSAGAFSNQKRPAAAAQQQRVGTGRPFRPLRPFEEPVGILVAGAFGFQLEQLPERARGSIPRTELVIQG